MIVFQTGQNSVQTLSARSDSLLEGGDRYLRKSLTLSWTRKLIETDRTGSRSQKVHPIIILFIICKTKIKKKIRPLSFSIRIYFIRILRMKFAKF